jgi:hypothetical protein
MAINIDTTAAVYQTAIANLDTLRTVMAPRIKTFGKLSRTKQLWWLQRDPLMRKLIRASYEVCKQVDVWSYLEETSSD